MLDRKACSTLATFTLCNSVCGQGYMNMKAHADITNKDPSCVAQLE